MSKRLAVGVVLAGAMAGTLLAACSSSDAHPAALGGCSSTFGCEPIHPGYSGDAASAGEAGEASTGSDAGIEANVPDVVVIDDGGTDADDAG